MLESHTCQANDSSCVIAIKDFSVRISTQDIENVIRYRWNVEKKARGEGYYVTSCIDGKKRNLNGFLVGTYAVHVGHKNGDSLDFRRENLTSLVDDIKLDGNVATMKISRNGVDYLVLFDSSDVQKVVGYGKRWSILNSGYVYGSGKYFHRFLLDIDDDREVDHDNQNPLDNRRENLIATTPKGNSTNRPNSFAIPGRYAKEKNPYRGKGQRRSHNAIPEVIREGDDALIPLTQGEVAIIDWQDLILVRDVLWYATWNEDKQSYYAMTKVNLGQREVTAYLHQVIMGTVGMGKKVRVDHIDGDTLNCRRSNLRITNASENGQNRTAQANRNSKTGVRNVYRHPSTRMLEVKVMVKGKGHYGGWYPDTEEGLQQATDAARLLREKLHTHSDGR